MIPASYAGFVRVPTRRRMTLAKKIGLLLLLNVATCVLSSVTSTSSPPLSSSPLASSGAMAEQGDVSSVNEVGGDGRAFYYYNGTAMVNTTTVAITLAFYSVIALGIYSLVAGAAAEQMAGFIEISPLEDAAFGITLDRDDKESTLEDYPKEQDGSSSYQVKKYKTEDEDYFADYEAWGGGEKRKRR